MGGQHSTETDDEDEGAGRFSHVFLLINAKSGGNAGDKLLELGIDFIKWKDPAVELRMFNLTDWTDRRNCMEQIQNLKSLKGSTRPVVVAAGGDGSVKWVITLLDEIGCSDIPIGVIPFGTGNDLSRVLGWGGSAPSKLKGKYLHALHDHCNKFSHAHPIPLDVWEVTIETKPEGGFKKVVKGESVAQPQLGTKVTEFMINYFSIGADAQVVWSFEKHRQKSRLANKMVYGVFGGKQTLPFVELPKIKELVVSAASFTTTASGEKQKRTNDNIKNDQIENILKLNPHASIRFHNLQPDAHALLWLNIPSYGGGSNIWGTGQQVTSAAVGRLQSSGECETLMEQSINDGLLEMMTMDRTSNVASFQATGGISEYLKEGFHREKQASGFDILLKYRKAYMQIDGEGLRVDLPHRVTIRRKGQVVVLCNQKVSVLSKSVDSWNRNINPSLTLHMNGDENESKNGTKKKPRNCRLRRRDAFNSPLSHHRKSITRMSGANLFENVNIETLKKSASRNDLKKSVSFTDLRTRKAAFSASQRRDRNCKGGYRESPNSVGSNSSIGHGLLRESLHHHLPAPDLEI
eukprot:g794.t1